MNAIDPCGCRPSGGVTADEMRQGSKGEPQADDFPVSPTSASVSGYRPPSTSGIPATDRWTVRQQLFQATHDNHVSINRHPMLVGITRKGFPLSQYRAVLTTYYRFFAVAEPMILASIARDEIPFSYAERCKLPWLEQDLRILGIAPPAPAAEAQALSLAGEAELIGVLYGIEGSTLGGQVISRHLRENLGLTADQGARFFVGYGLETAQRWEVFCAFAERLASFPEQCRQAASAANRLFGVIRGLFDELKCQ